MELSDFISKSIVMYNGKLSILYGLPADDSDDVIVEIGPGNFEKTTLSQLSPYPIDKVVLEQIYGLQVVTSNSYDLNEDVVAFLDEDGCNICTKYRQFNEGIQEWEDGVTDLCTIKYAHEFQALMSLLGKKL